MIEPQLFEYGIQTEISDIRAHVSVANHAIYVFRTRCGVEAIERYQPQLRLAYQPGVDGATASGWLVKIDWIEDLRRLPFRSWDGWACFQETLSTSEKGRLAVDAVTAAMRLGRFPFWVDAWEDDRAALQIKGTDIVVFCRQRVQVKCDFRGGDLPLGTGNLFLQKAERNPLRRR